MRSPRPRLLRTPASIQLASARASYCGGGVARVVGTLAATAVLVINLAGQAPSPPPGPDVTGPQPGITCPVGAVDIWPGSSIQNVVNLHPAGTTFCLLAGVHSMDRSITPRTGDTYVGQYGAILDGIGWTTADDTQGAFRVYDDPNDPNDPNGDVDYVTIRNLVIRNMPQYGIHASYTRKADHWTIEYNEIASNKFGLMFTSDFTIRNNYIHHNVGNASSPNPGERGGGYLGQYADNSIVDNNEIAWNGPEQKVGLSASVRFRNNFVHHNVRDGIWYDLNPNAGALIEGNRVEDNGRTGISFEISNGATIRNNTVRRNAADAVLISMSQNAQIHNNALEANFGGIQYFLNCRALLEEGHDLTNNAAYDNTIVVGTQSFAYANGFSHLSECTSAQLAPYVNGSKNLTFSRHTYSVPSATARYWLWGMPLEWGQWQSIGQDVEGVVSPLPPQS